MTFAARLVAAWYATRLTPLTAALVPLAAAFAAATALRRQLYRWHVLRSEPSPVPVVVVGNTASRTVAGRMVTPRGYRWQE